MTRIQLDPGQLLDMLSGGTVRKVGSSNRNDDVKAALMETLAALGGLTVTDDDIAFTGSKVVLPEVFEGRIDDAINYLAAYRDGQEKHYDYSRKFNYRPWDGAAAFNRAMMRVFGTAGMGKDTWSFFEGQRPPQLLDIEVGVGKTMQVPWGQVEFPQLEAVFSLNMIGDPEYGKLFVLQVNAPKKYRAHIEAFFSVVNDELKKNSIYKGKAITGAEMPTFLDVNRVDPNRVFYAAEVSTQLEANLWSLIKYSDAMRENGVPLKRQVLVEGPYGTGKTLAGMLTGKCAVENGWTYILCRPGQDDLLDVLKTAQLYAPAVVWFEDIDIVAADADSDESISSVLDALDGTTAKGVEVIAGFTTNHVDKIQKAVMRPGRLDAIVHIGELDEAAFAQMVDTLLPKEIRGEIDLSRVSKAFVGFLPAFAAEAIDRAKRYNIARNEGKITKIDTDDLVDAALGLRPQLELMNKAQEGASPATIDTLVTGLIEDALNSAIFESDTEGRTGLAVVDDRKFD